MTFIDEASVEVRAGGPAGGEGGRGGAVWARPDRNVNTLVDYRFARIHRAEHGENGRGSDQYGRAGRDIELRMPVGTIIREARGAAGIADLADKGARAPPRRGG